MRALGAIVVAVLIAGCGGAPGGVTSTGSPASNAPAGSQATAGSQAPADPELFDQLVAGGLPIDDATFLAATTFEGFTMEPRKGRIVEHLASGDTVGFIVTVSAASSGEPGLISFSSTTDGDRISVRLEYFLSAEGMPDDAREALEGVAARGPQLASLRGGPPPILTAEVSGFNVVVDWAMAKGQSFIRDQTIAAILQQVAPTQVGPIMKIFKAGLTANKGLSLGDDLDALLAEVAALEECAKNPTNPLTQQVYQEDPGAKARVLQHIDDVRNNLIASTLVNQLGVLNGYAASFGPKWLAYAIGPGTAWSKAVLNDVDRERVEQLKRAIPKCDSNCAWGTTSSPGGGGGSGGSSGGSTGAAPTAGPTCRFPFTLTGRVEYSRREDGEIVFTATIKDIKWQYDPSTSAPPLSVYNLVAGTIDWRYDDSDPEPGCGTHERHGGGRESVVPDEAPDPGGEVGPGRPTEHAFLAIHWADADPSRPVPYYDGQAIARLHDPIIDNYSCGGDVREVEASFFGSWLFLPFNPWSLVKDNRLAGDWEDNGAIYKWEFSEGP